MAQRVREDPLVGRPHAGPLGDGGDDAPDVGAADAPPARAQEGRVGVAVAGLVGARAAVARAELGAAGAQVGEESPARDGRDGHGPPRAALAQHDHEGVLGVVEVAGGEVERGGLARPQTTSVQHLDQRVGTPAERAGQGGGRVADAPHGALGQGDDLPGDPLLALVPGAGRAQVAHRVLEGEQPRPPAAEGPGGGHPAAAARGPAGQPVAPVAPPLERQRGQRAGRRPGRRVVLHAEGRRRSLRRGHAERRGEGGEVASVGRARVGVGPGGQEPGGQAVEPGRVDTGLSHGGGPSAGPAACPWC